MQHPPMTIGTLARAAAVNVETVRFYHRRGLMPLPYKPPGGLRHYGESDLARIRFIRTAQGLGFSLDEVALLLRLDDGTRCADARVIGAHKLAQVRRRLRELRQVEAALAGLVRRCRVSRGRVSCPLIATLQERPGRRAPAARTRAAPRAPGRAPRTRR